METVHSLTTSRCDAAVSAVAADLSARSSHIVLERLPPDYEQESRDLESSVEQNKQDVPEEEGSDSGDSLFITQKPVPKAVRSARRRRYKLNSVVTSQRSLEESDSSLPSSDEESKTDRVRRTRKKCVQPKYSFNFLSGKKSRKTVFGVQNNKIFNHYVMKGFFKCVMELNAKTSVPTVDTEGDDISPLSEEENDGSRDEDFKVVERKCLIAPLKAKRCQTWCNQFEQQKRRQFDTAGQEMSLEPQIRMVQKRPANAPTSSIPPLSFSCPEAESSHNGEAVCSLLNERRRGDELAQNKTPKRNRSLFSGYLKATEDNSTDATVGVPLVVYRSPVRGDKEASRNGAYDEAQVGQMEGSPESQNLLHTNLTCDSSNETAGSKTRAKKKKKKKKKDEMGQRQEEAEDLNASESVTVEPEPSATQVSDEPEFNEGNCMQNVSHDNITVRQEETDVPHMKRKKKKRKKPGAASVREEEDGSLGLEVRTGDPLISVSMENGGRTKKKRDEDVEKLQSSTADELLDDANVVKLKRKEDETLGVAEECEEHEAKENTSSEVTLELNSAKHKKLKRKRRLSSNETTQAEEVIDTGVSNDVTSLGKTREKSGKKKKRTLPDWVNVSYIPEDSMQTEKEGVQDQNAELVTEKKKKSEITSRNTSEESVVRSIDSVSAWSKEKKRTSYFLFADVGKRDSPSCSVGVWDLATESAEITGNSEASNDGARKKTRKRDCEEADLNLETTDTGVKRKKKVAGNQVDSVNSGETVENAAESGPQKKKKKRKVDPHSVTEENRQTDDEGKSEKSMCKEKEKRFTFSLVSPGVAESHASFTVDRQTPGTPIMSEQASPPSETSGNQTVKHKREKIKMMSPDFSLLQEKSPNKSIHFESKANTRGKKSPVKHRITKSPMLSDFSLPEFEILSSGCVERNKDKKVKRKLHNPSEDLLDLTL